MTRTESGSTLVTIWVDCTTGETFDNWGYDPYDFLNHPDEDVYTEEDGDAIR